MTNRKLLDKAGDIRVYYHYARKDVEIWRADRYVTSMPLTQYNQLFKKIFNGEGN